MRQYFQTQPDLQLTPIEKIRLPFNSRDELPVIFALRELGRAELQPVRHRP